MGAPFAPDPLFLPCKYSVACSEDPVADVHHDCRTSMPPSQRLTKRAFDFGDYNAAAEEEESHQLSWRDDPEESLSDWTIVVSSAGEESTFHVHKAMLAAHHAQQRRAAKRHGHARSFADARAYNLAKRWRAEKFTEPEVAGHCARANATVLANLGYTCP